MSLVTADNISADPPNLNPPPIELVVLDSGTYFFRIESHNWQTGYYKVSFDDIVDKQFLLALFPSVGSAGDTITVAGINLGNHPGVSLIPDSGQAIAVPSSNIISIPTRISLTLPSLQLNRDYHIKISSSAGTSDDESVALHNASYGIHTRQVPKGKGIVEAAGKSQMLSFGDTIYAIGYSGEDRAGFGFSAKAGESAKITVHLDDGNTPALKLLGPHSQMIIPPDVSFDPETRVHASVFSYLPVSGKFIIKVREFYPLPENTYELVLQKLNDMAADGIRAYSGYHQLYFPGQTPDPLCVQVLSHGKDLAAADIPIVFRSGYDKKAIKLTDESGRACVNVVMPTPYGEYAEADAYLGENREIWAGFEIYVRASP